MVAMAMILFMVILLLTRQVITTIGQTIRIGLAIQVILLVKVADYLKVYGINMVGQGRVTIVSMEVLATILCMVRQGMTR